MVVPVQPARQTKAVNTLSVLPSCGHYTPTIDTDFVFKYDSSASGPPSVP